jgi:hypothetical protein
VGPRASLDAGARRKILRPCQGSNPDRPARSQTLYCLSYHHTVFACPNVIKGYAFCWLLPSVEPSIKIKFLISVFSHWVVMQFCFICTMVLKEILCELLA